jgi:hypothetical protein
MVAVAKTAKLSFRSQSESFSPVRIKENLLAVGARKIVHHGTESGNIPSANI